jgi:hypothetical protein
MRAKSPFHSGEIINFMKDLNTGGLKISSVK